MLTAVSGTARCRTDFTAGRFCVQPERLITRGEVVAALFALHDILEEVREIRRLIGDDDGEEEEESEDEG